MVRTGAASVLGVTEGAVLAQRGGTHRIGGWWRGRLGGRRWSRVGGRGRRPGVDRWRWSDATPYAAYTLSATALSTVLWEAIQVGEQTEAAVRPAIADPLVMVGSGRAAPATIRTWCAGGVGVGEAVGDGDGTGSVGELVGAGVDLAWELAGVVGPPTAPPTVRARSPTPAAIQAARRPTARVRGLR